jgi:hypothetical protein
MSPFKVEAGKTICLGCGARIGPTTADKVEHLTTPSRAHARARQKQQRDQTNRRAS